MSFPTNLSNFLTGSSSGTLASVSHAANHNALEAKVGIDGSSVTTSHDYKLSGVATGDKAVSLTGTETLTNKTITSPQINAISAVSGNSVIDFTNVATGRSRLAFDNTENNPRMMSVGTATDIGLTIGTKGAGTIKLKSGSSTTNGHTVPNVADDTVCLIGATQTLVGKTLTAPVISTISNTGTLTLPTSKDTLLIIKNSNPYEKI